MFIGSLIAPFTAFDTPDDTGGQAPPEPEEQAPEPEYFDEKFDPASLTPEQEAPYKHLLGHYQRKTQSLAEERRNLANPEVTAEQFASWTPEQRQTFFDKVGLEYESGDEPEYEEEEEDDFFRDPRVDVMLARDQEREQEKAQAAFHDSQLVHINEELEALEESTGREFTQKEVNAIGKLSEQMLDDRGMPNVEEAFHLFTEAVNERRQAQNEPRKRARTAPTGQPGAEKVDLLDPEARKRAVAAEIEAAGAEETI